MYNDGELRSPFARRVLSVPTLDATQRYRKCGIAGETWLYCQFHRAILESSSQNDDLEDRFRLILPAATAIGIRLRHASREISGLGGPLSNTRITCPKVGDNLGKLRIIPHRSRMLERFLAQNSGALGLVCGLSGCSGCNGPTSL